jgi:hypothetical protein
VELLKPSARLVILREPKRLKDLAVGETEKLPNGCHCWLVERCQRDASRSITNLTRPIASRIPTSSAGRESKGLLADLKRYLTIAGGVRLE